MAMSVIEIEGTDISICSPTPQRPHKTFESCTYSARAILEGRTHDSGNNLSPQLGDIPARPRLGERHSIRPIPPFAKEGQSDQIPIFYSAYD